MKNLIFYTLLASLFFSCSKEDSTLSNNPPSLTVDFSFNTTQERLDNLGQPTGIAEGNAAQTPKVNGMSAHYIELAPDAFTPLGSGEVLYMGEETTLGGEKAIDFSKAKVVADRETFLEIPISQINPGTYEWVRISVSYQNGTIDVLADDNLLTGSLVSFLGYNTFIQEVDVNGSNLAVNENKLQGFWVFEVLGFLFNGQAPEGAVTVPNPLFETSPIPQGSCVITGKFANPLVITGNETEPIRVDLSFSVNNSFEWTEVNADGYYEPGIGEELTDMGLRGLVPTYN